MGRTKENPKYKVLSIRVSDGDLKRVEACAESPDQSTQDLVWGLVEIGMQTRERDQHGEING